MGNFNANAGKKQYGHQADVSRNSSRELLVDVMELNNLQIMNIFGELDSRK